MGADEVDDNGARFFLTTNMRLLDLETACSDKLEAPADGDLTEETWISSESVRSMAAQACRKKGTTWCDDSFDSGRQLDECLVCGGGCFLPACSAKHGGCAAVQPSTLSDALQPVVLRYAGEFTQTRARLSDEEKRIGATLLTSPGDGWTSKRFTFTPSSDNADELGRVPKDKACPADSRDILCEPVDCRLVVGQMMCRGRREAYRAHTSHVRMRSGDTFVFHDNGLLIEPQKDQRTWRLTVELALVPAVAPSTRPESDDDLVAALSMRPLGAGFIQLPRLNETGHGAHNLSNVEKGADGRRITLEGNIQVLNNVLRGLKMTAHEPSFQMGRLVLRFWWQLAGKDVVNAQYTRKTANMECISPWIRQPTCDMLKWSTDISIIWTTQDDDLRRVEVPINVGRLPSRSGPGGHGTFIAALVAGHDKSVLSPVAEADVGPENRGALGFCNDLDAIQACESEPLDTLGGLTHECYKFVQLYQSGVAACAGQNEIFLISSACKLGLKCFGQSMLNQNSLSYAAKLVVVDLHATSHDLKVPDAQDILLKPYSDSGARISLLSFSAQDFMWWRDLDRFTSLTGPNLCNRYTSLAKGIDEFVAAHPDLLVVVAAGSDGGNGAAMSISAPGTCKNCLTVGSTQGWLPHLEHASRRDLASVCRDEDCPQLSRAGRRARSLFDQSTCALPSSTPPGNVPDCCSSKYALWNFSADKLHWNSARGPAVTKQAAPMFAGVRADIYHDISTFEAKRFKPELLAPGLHVVSARARNAGDAIPAPGECSSKFVAAGGSDVSAALAASAAALVRQYFLEGFYVGGYRFLPWSWRPSAAMVKAVLLTSGQHVGMSMFRDGSTKVIPKDIPNFDIGFGLINLQRTLFLNTAPVRQAECACISVPMSEEEEQKLGREFGSTCAMWDSGVLPGREHLNCSTLYRNVESYPGELSRSEKCCRPWCFVGETCLQKKKSRLLPGRWFTYQACDIKTISEEFDYKRCQYHDKLQVLNLKSFYRDHASPAGYTPLGKPLKISPKGPPIAQNESMSYNLTIVRASQTHPLIVTLSFTDLAPLVSSADVMVNDLDLSVTVTPLKVSSYDTVEASQELSDLNKLPRRREEALVYWGNSIEGGDQNNNNEQVRLESLGPSEIVISVSAKRVVNGSQTLSKYPQIPDMQGCQSFALAMTGHFATTQESHFDHFVHPMIPTPNPLPVHICGRMPLEPLIESRPRNLFSRIQMIAIGIAAGAAGLLTLTSLYYCYLKRRNRMRSRITSNAAVVQESTKTTNKHLQLHLNRDILNQHSESQYVSDVLPDVHIPQCDGHVYLCRGGGTTSFILDHSASDSDDAYTGMAIHIVDGPGKGESRVISGYVGATYLATVAHWQQLPVANKTKYVIHSGANSRGYSFGGLLHQPTGWTPTPLSALQHAQAHAVQHVQFDPSDMAVVGKRVRVRGELQNAMEALNDLKHKGVNQVCF